MQNGLDNDTEYYKKNKNKNKSKKNRDVLRKVTNIILNVMNATIIHIIHTLSSENQNAKKRSMKYISLSQLVKTLMLKVNSFTKAKYVVVRHKRTTWSSIKDKNKKRKKTQKHIDNSSFGWRPMLRLQRSTSDLLSDPPRPIGSIKDKNKKRKKTRKHIDNSSFG